MGNIYNYMISLKRLLVENPDTVYYKKKTYSYTTPANKCAFFIYKDEKSGKNSLFGYSAVKKEFLSDDPEVLKDVDELDKAPDIKYTDGSRDQNDYWAQKALRQLKSGNNGGGHLQLENLLKGIGRFGIYADPILKGRIFEVDDSPSVTPPNLDIQIESTIPSGKAIVVTFWDSKRDRIIKYKDQYDKAIEFNGYDPKECLYEPSMKFYTYDEFYKNEEPKPIVKEPVKDVPKQQDGGASEFFKVGDKVKIKGMDIFGDVLSIQGNNNITLKVTQSDMVTVPVGSNFQFPYFGLELDNRTQGESLEKVIDDKTQEFVEKRGKLHTTGATFTPAEKANLEREVDGLEIELKMLNNYLKNGGKTYTDELKNLVSRSVQRKLHDKEKQKQDRYSLIAQAEKQYGMPIAQIRQKYRGVPLDQLVKKESLYKKLLKALLG